MRVATFNINGIRATHRRGFGDWLASRDCDVVALQEVRAPVAALPDGAFGGYHAAYDPGTLAGRNGVAILTRMPPAAVRTWGAPAVRLDPDGQPTREAPDPDDRDGTAYPRLARELRDFAHQGRYLEVDLADAPVTIASLYLPKGGLPAHLQVAGRMREAPDGGARYERKMRFLAGFARQVTAARRQARAAGREFLLLGDLNIAHEPLDVVNWRRQVRNEGFLPEEREWFGALVGPRRLVDVVRRLHPDTQGPYSWWSWLGESFTNDTGWRIDYHLATPRLARAAITRQWSSTTTSPRSGYAGDDGLMRTIAQVDRRPTDVVVTSWSISSNALGQFNGWWVVLPADASDEVIGTAVLDAWRVSAERAGFAAAPLSREAPDLLAPVYAAVGATSARAYTRGASAVALERSDGVVVVQPMRARAGGFTAYEPEAEYAADLTASALEALCRAALGG